MVNIMKISAILTILFGMFLVALAIGIFQSLLNCKNDGDLVLYLLMLICSGFGGICFVVAGIVDYNKAK